MLIEESGSNPSSRNTFSGHPDMVFSPVTTWKIRNECLPYHSGSLPRPLHREVSQRPARPICFWISPLDFLRFSIIFHEIKILSCKRYEIVAVFKNFHFTRSRVGPDSVIIALILYVVVFDNNARALRFRLWVLVRDALLFNNDKIRTSYVEREKKSTINLVLILVSHLIVVVFFITTFLPHNETIIIISRQLWLYIYWSLNSKYLPTAMYSSI